jgi:hypothetical protein
MALWIPAVMIALESIRTVKRVTNPSAVRKTRKARMTELTAAAQRPYTMADAAAVEIPTHPYSDAYNLNDR